MDIKLQRGDVILMHNKGYIGKLIVKILRFFQSDEVNYSHVAIAVSESEVTEAAWSGIIMRSFEKSIAKAQCVKVIRYKDLTENQKMWIEERALSKVGTDYNFYRLILQLFDNVFRTNWFTKTLKISNEWHICSTYVAWIYKALGIYFNETHWFSVEPDDIDDEVLKGEYWEQIYRGQRYC